MSHQGLLQGQFNLFMDACELLSMTGEVRTRATARTLFYLSILTTLQILKHKKQTPWSLVRERTIPTDLPPLVGEI
jgi:hypothetical protein